MCHISIVCLPKPRPTLFAHRQLIDTPTNQSGKQLTSSDSCGQWLIDNAYYAANTKVVIRRPDGSKFGSLTGYDAIILVFDATQQDTWHAVSAWAESNADALEQTEIALVCGVGWISHTWYTLHPSPAMANKQVVANKYDLVQTQQQHGAGDTSSSSTNKQGCSEWLEEVQDWCLEHHCEYIRAAAAHAPTDNSLARYLLHMCVGCWFASG